MTRLYMKTYMVSFLTLLLSSITLYGQSINGPYQELENLFQEWRVFETPPRFEGAPDSRSQTFTNRRAGFKIGIL